MKYLHRLVLVGVLALTAVGAFGQANPKDVLKEITQLRASRQIRTQAEFTALNAEVKAKAETAIKDVDPAKVAAADAYDWAQIFAFAGKHKEVCDLAMKFLTTNPAPDQKFAAQTLMLQSCNAL